MTKIVNILIFAALLVMISFIIKDFISFVLYTDLLKLTLFKIGIAFILYSSLFNFKKYFCMFGAVLIVNSCIFTFVLEFMKIGHWS